MKPNDSSAGAAEPLPPHAGAALDASHILDSDGTLALRASRCMACGQATFPASSICPFCLAEATQPLPLAGDARLYSFTSVHVAPKTWRTPYALGYADFPNGLRLLAKLESPATAWQCNQPVRLKIEGTDDGRYRYYLEGAAS